MHLKKNLIVVYRCGWVMVAQCSGGLHLGEIKLNLIGVVQWLLNVVVRTCGGGLHPKAVLLS